MPETQVKVPSARVEPTSGEPPAPGSDTYVTVIRPPTALPRLPLSEIWRYRELLGIFVWRDIKVRYKQTVLGIAWAVLQPALTMIVFTLFFGKLARVPSDGVAYPLFAYAGILPWTLMAAGVGASSGSVVGSPNLITKVYFPRMIIPGAAVLSGLVDFLIAAVGLALLMARYGGHVSWTLVGLVPVVGLILLLAAGVGGFLAAVNVKYRDVRYIVPFFMQLWMFATPVIYSASLVPARWRELVQTKSGRVTASIPNRCLTSLRCGAILQTSCRARRE